MTGDLEDIINYLKDLDNLIDTGHFEEKSIKDYTFYHKEMNLNEFIRKGREIIRQSEMRLKGMPEKLIFDSVAEYEDNKAEHKEG